MSKVLVITGASRGIGLATARQFQQEGYLVINLSRTSIDNSIGSQIHTDISQSNWLDLCKHQLLELVGSPSKIVLVHNASILLKDSISSASNDFARVFQTNVIAAQQLNELLIEKMPRGSSIHYIGSTLSEKAVANALTYATSKHATLGLMRASCQDLMGTGIHCSCVCPGFTDTQMLREHLGGDQDILKAIASMNGFERLIEPEEIAKTVFFAANNPALNGAVIHANLGQREN